MAPPSTQRTAEPSGWQFAIRALKHRNYALFFSGQTVSLIGTWMTRIATAWLVYRLTHSAFLLGLVELRWANPDLPAGALRRRVGGPLEPASRAGHHSDAFHGAIVLAGGAGAQPSHHGG